MRPCRFFFLLLPCWLATLEMTNALLAWVPEWLWWAEPSWRLLMDIRQKQKLNFHLSTHWDVKAVIAVWSIPKEWVSVPAGPRNHSNKATTSSHWNQEIPYPHESTKPVTHSPWLFTQFPGATPMQPCTPCTSSCTRLWAPVNCRQAHLCSVRWLCLTLPITLENPSLINRVSRKQLKHLPKNKLKRRDRNLVSDQLSQNLWEGGDWGSIFHKYSPQWF